MCTLVLAMNFALFLAKNLHLSFSPLEWRWVHTFRCQKRCTLRNSSHSSFCFCQMAWPGIKAPKQMIEFPAAPSFFSSKKWIKLIPKTIGNRKRDCAWGCARRINTTWENLQIEKHKSVRWAERTHSWFVLFDLQIFSGGVYPPSATSRAISFPISNSFWVLLRLRVDRPHAFDCRKYLMRNCVRNVEVWQRGSLRLQIDFMNVSVMWKSSSRNPEITDDFMYHLYVTVSVICKARNLSNMNRVQKAVTLLDVHECVHVNMVTRPLATAPVGTQQNSHEMWPVLIRHSSHHFATQSSHSVDRAGWQAKMASIEVFFFFLVTMTLCTHASFATTSEKAWSVLPCSAVWMFQHENFSPSQAPDERNLPDCVCVCVCVCVSVHVCTVCLSMRTCVCVCARVRACLCHNDNKMLDKWQARHVTQSIPVSIVHRKV